MHDDVDPPPALVPPPPELPLAPPPVNPPPPPPAQVTGAHSAGTALGVQPGSLVCAWTHWNVPPLYVTTAPATYGTHAAHAVAVAHSPAESSSWLDSEPSPALEPQPIAEAALKRATRTGSVVLEFMPP